jgi:HlyD family secretion protein
MTRKKRWVIGGGVVLLLAALVGISVSRGGESASAVRLETVARRTLIATVTASGRIQPKSAVDVSSDITGRIIAIPVVEGQTVRRGDLLIRIDPAQYEAQVAQMEAQLASAQAAAVQAQANRQQAERALARTQELRQSNPNLVTDEQLEQATTAFEVADAVSTSAQRQVDQSRAGVQRARDELGKTVLRAPIAGTVTRVAVEEGEVAVPGTFSRETGLLMTVSDMSVIQVQVQVDETDVIRLALGDSAEVTIDAFPDTTFAGRVTKVAQSAVRMPAGGATADRAVDFDVEITLDNPPADIRPDLSATARIITDVRLDALSVPIIALTVRADQAISTETAPQDTTRHERNGVFVVREGVAHFVAVRIGITGAEHFEVIDGIAEGDSIVAGPYQTVRDLRDSARVRPQATTTAGPRT